MPLINFMKHDENEALKRVCRTFSKGAGVNLDVVQFAVVFDSNFCVCLVKNSDSGKIISYGVSKCNLSDKHNRIIGGDIAVSRAIIKIQ